MSKQERPQGALARNVRRLGHLDLPGAGQVTVSGGYAYVGHIPNKQNLGTSIVDVSDPANPRLVATVTLDDGASHSHKVRVVGGLDVVSKRVDVAPVRARVGARSRGRRRARGGRALRARPAERSRDRGHDQLRPRPA